MDKRVDFVLRIIAWSLLLIGIILLILMVTGIVHSPEETLVSILIGAGILVELGRIESKVSILWKDFEKRKKL